MGYSEASFNQKEFPEVLAEFSAVLKKETNNPPPKNKSESSETSLPQSS